MGAIIFSQTFDGKKIQKIDRLWFGPELIKLDQSRRLGLNL